MLAFSLVREHVSPLHKRIASERDNALVHQCLYLSTRGHEKAHLMSVEVTLDMHGLDALLAGWDEGIAHLLDTTAFDVLSNAQQLAPVKTGYLRNSGHVEPGDDKYSRYVVFSASYAIYVHEGTRFMMGRPFLLQSVEHHRNTFQDNFSAFFGRLVER